MVLCSYANFRTSYRRLEGTSYTVFPGEWICRLTEITEWFRMRFQYQSIEMLEYLQRQQYITFSRHANGKLVRFKIVDWEKFNTVLDYNAPCQKDTGFFFFPVTKANEFVRLGKCSELDIVLDLWINTVYNEERVRGSELGPVVYFRNCTGNPFVSYKEISERWGISKSTAGRILNKLGDKEYISLVPCTGRRGSVIYLKSYLSTMFDISDVMIDKDEIAMSLNINIRVDDEVKTISITEEQISVSAETISVPKSHIASVVQKIAQTLAAFGVSCCECPKSIYRLYDYPGCKEKYIYEIDIGCTLRNTRYQFELKIIPLKNTGGEK